MGIALTEADQVLEGRKMQAAAICTCFPPVVVTVIRHGEQIGFELTSSDCDKVEERVNCNEQQHKRKMVSERSEEMMEYRQACRYSSI